MKDFQKIKELVVVPERQSVILSVQHNLVIPLQDSVQQMGKYVTWEFPWTLIDGTQLTSTLEKQALEAYQTVQNLLTLKASVEDIAEGLDVLEGGLTMQKIANENARARAYVVALDGVSLWSLLQAVKNLIRGEAKGMSTTFVPSSADLAKYCRNLEYALYGATEKIFLAVENTRNKALGGKRISFMKIGKPEDCQNKLDSDACEEQRGKAA
ncbi:hypothetical protein [Bartonella taylorii]|uniref:Uncharacterized protein n=1 Tax=Bartonella taylorii TaxID=33046 RepID=A0A9Q8YWD8_BARTA|nr:hypothetical protein [Bartonella taylorii]USP02164.1 hypothetical protein LAJ60_04515 [Bartonella taylorii]